MMTTTVTNLRPIAWALALALLVSGAAAAQVRLDPAYPGTPLAGPAAARGAVVWSHGRSVASEDSLAPTPGYMSVLREGGWDTFRFNRMREGDTLPDSARALVAFVGELKQRGYRRVVLTGQSFGAFISLMAADVSEDVHAVIATAPAAYGSFSDYYESWQSNALRLYPLLEGVRGARVMLFYFHGDDFDPGGRGPRSKAILAAHNIDNLVVDQPPQLTGHWAATTGLFVRRFGGCIRDFIEAETTTAVACNSSWGQSPSKQVAFPAHFHGGQTAEPSGRAGAFAGRWYGYYGNGREVMFAIEQVEADKVTAIYALGPGLAADERPEWVRRTGRLIGDELVFADKDHPTLRYRLRDDGKLQAWWQSPDGQSWLETTLRHTDWPGTATLSASAGGQ